MFITFGCLYPSVLLTAMDHASRFMHSACHVARFRLVLTVVEEGAFVGRFCCVRSDTLQHLDGVVTRTNS